MRRIQYSSPNKEIPMLPRKTAFPPVRQMEFFNAFNNFPPKKPPRKLPYSKGNRLYLDES